MLHCIHADMKTIVVSVHICASSTYSTLWQHGMYTSLHESWDVEGCKVFPSTWNWHVAISWSSGHTTCLPFHNWLRQCVSILWPWWENNMDGIPTSFIGLICKDTFTKNIAISAENLIYTCNKARVMLFYIGRSQAQMRLGFTSCVPTIKHVSGTKHTRDILIFLQWSI